MHRALITILLVFFMHSAYAQMLWGHVKDENDVVIEKATIRIENSSYSTVTDENGTFTLLAPAGEHTIVVEYEGTLPATKKALLREGYDYNIKAMMVVPAKKKKEVSSFSFHERKQ